MKEQERLLGRAAELLRTAPGELPERIEGLRQRVQASEDELETLWSRQLTEEAERLTEGATDGVVAARRDHLSRDRLRQLAMAVRDRPGQRAAVLAGTPDGRGVALVAAVARSSGLVASDLLREAAKVVGGGGGNDPEVAVAGGRDVARIDEALGVVRAQLGRA
jgi:alanyl-tRNA synthetase